MSEKGLGTGLGALLGDAVLDTDERDSIFLPISQVEPALGQPRKRFDEAAIAELAESITRYGVIQPLTVRRLDSGYYQIIAGERRWRAARLAGLREIPVRIIEATDAEAMELALVENLQREDLNPIEEAEGFQTLIETYGLTQDEAATCVGRSRPAVANALRLLNLPAELRELVEKSELSAGHARALLALKDEGAQLKLAQRIIEKELSVRQTEMLVRDMTKPPKPEPEKPLVDYVGAVETRLTRALGRKVRLVTGKKKGRFEIEYYGADDLEVLIEALEKLGGK